MESLWMIEGLELRTAKVFRNTNHPDNGRWAHQFHIFYGVSFAGQC